MDAKEPKVNLKKVEVNNGVMDVEIESEEIVRFFVEHMKELFDSVKGAENYYSLTMKFAGDLKFYTITFQRHPGKTPAQIYDEQIQELELKLAKSKEEAQVRFNEAKALENMNPKDGFVPMVTMPNELYHKKLRLAAGIEGKEEE